MSEEGLRLKVKHRTADNISPPERPTSCRLGVMWREGLRLAVKAAAAELPPLLICLRATGQPHKETERERQIGVALRGD